ncbi:MAG: PhzF family phenazine biosynthesis protein [Acidobacteria bacterium]|nr:PhzF family phenazine biosynthesis protein [Acidobacteriota bacterium]
MVYRFHQVDAFTDKPFAGNPAAVFVLPEPRDADWMQLVAREMNLSETAFLVRGNDGFDLRWFTPAVEVQLCGHATLASARVLWEEEHLRPDEAARFHTKSGLLTARRAGEWIELDFPARPEQRAEAPAGLAEALGLAPRYVGRSREDLLVLVDAEEDVRGARPDITRLRALPVRGLIVTAAGATPGVDFVSRFFAPAVGVDEDPVTGSAHCTLAPFWTGRLGRAELVGRQLSTRGGTVRTRLAGDRVVLGGQAVTVVRGELRS